MLPTSSVGIFVHKKALNIAKEYDIEVDKK